MAYTKLYYHIIFRTKNSQQSLNEQNEKELYQYIWGFCKSRNSHLLRINGMPDHLHLLVSIHPSIAVSEFVHDLKISVGNFCKKNPEKFPLFSGWGDGYCAITYGGDDVDKVYQYIKNQKEHHRKVSLREELINVLTECGIPYDERYI